MDYMHASTSKHATGLENRIRLVEHAIKARCGNQGSCVGVFYLTITEAVIVTPIAIKKFVTFRAKGEEDSIRFGDEYSITKFSETRTRAARDNLVERVEWVECIGRNTGLGMGRRAWRS